MNKLFNKPIYYHRTFANLWHDSISLFRAHIVYLFRIYLLFGLPISLCVTAGSAYLVQFLQNYYISSMSEYNSSSMWAYHNVINSYFIYTLSRFILTSWASYLLFCYIKYIEDNTTEFSFSISAYFTIFKEHFIRFILLFLFLFMIVFLVGGFMYLMVLKFTSLAIVLFFLVLFVPSIYWYAVLRLIIPTHLFGDSDILESINKAFYTNNNNWTHIFPFIFIVDILLAIFYSIVSLPKTFFYYFLNISSIVSYNYIINGLFSIFFGIFICICYAFGAVCLFILFASYSDYAKSKDINSLIDSINSIDETL